MFCKFFTDTSRSEASFKGSVPRKLDFNDSGKKLL